jgi:DNA-directed RNA polymerase specialized sigma24 family protein
MVQAALGSLNRLPDEERQVLVGTLRAWLACDGSTEATAKVLSCPPSTVRCRLNRALQPLLCHVTESELPEGGGGDGLVGRMAERR